MVGHGVGREMHEDPQVPNFGPPHQGPGTARGHGDRHRAHGQHGRLRRGGRRGRWAIYTKDGSLSAHFEHTVAVTKDGPRPLTAAQAVGGLGERGLVVT